MANLRRNETLSKVLGVYEAPAAGYLINAYAAGAIASGTQTTGGSTSDIPVYAGHGFNINDFAMKGIDTTKVYRVTAIAATTITVASITVVSADLDVFVNIGPDVGMGGGGPPSWVQSTPNVIIYTTPDTTHAITNSIVTADSGGNYGYFFPATTTIWELIRTAAGDPVRAVIQNPSTVLGSTGTPFVTNAIARWADTSGTLIKSAYTSNTPTISDAGAITAAGAHTLGQTGNTVAIAGAATVAQTLGVTGNTTVGGTLGVTGAMTAAAGLAVTGATSTTTSLTSATLSVSGNASLGADTTVKRIKATNGASVVTGDFVLSAGWGGTASKSAISGTDSAFTITVTASATTSADPTITFTYHDSTWTTAPFPIAILSGGTGAATTLQALVSTTATVMTITLKGTPTAGLTYIFHAHVIG